MSDSEIQLRPEKESDIPFLRSLFATTRVDVTFSNLPEAQKEEFITMQFNAQRHHYLTKYDNRDFLIIEQRKRPIGRLYLSRMSDQIRVMDLTILPAHRNKGIGTRLLRDVQSQARSLGLSVTLHAEKMGDMAAYYRRLGFEVVSELEMHFFMKWVSGTAPSIIIT